MRLVCLRVVLTISLFYIVLWNTCEGRETKIFFHQDKELLLEHLTSEEIEYLNENSSFTYCADPQWKPLEWIDDGFRHQGYIADYLALISHGLGINFELFPTNSWTSTLEAIKQRDCDFVSAAMQTQVRELYVNFTQPYLSYAFAIAVHKDADWSTSESYKSKTIALVEGYSYEEKLRANYPGIKLRHVKSVREGMDLASALKVDGFVDSAMVIAYSINHDGYMNLKIAERLPEHMRLSIAVRNDDDVLLSILNKAVQNINENQKREIQEYWEAKYVTTDLVPTWALLFSKVAIVFLAAILSIFISIFLFKKKQYSLSQLTQSQDSPQQNKRIYSRSEIQEILIGPAYQETVGGYVPLLVKIDEADALVEELGLGRFFKIQKQFEMQCLDLLPDGSYIGNWFNYSYLVLIPRAHASNLIVIAEHVRYEISYRGVNQGTNMTSSMLLPKDNDYDDILAYVHAMSSCFSNYKKGKDVVLTYPMQHRPFMPEDKVVL
ncbi:transporter substrate-binding domain-containing protein [Pseudoalteromonas sp. T1lg23B]|uniref:transporter substrate-binding domain-containing protein n=1 Tax=Pseudoalteromonas sp. T1lg23B TaxID=2077097 RepID=UPI000CF6F371|nr:transporter substrate-binding domain-containing protein [Pseudoalteromonas sp. T1lg23B]